MPKTKKAAKKSTGKSIKSTAVSRKKKQHPKHFLKVYWPYIPVILMTVFSLVFGSLLPLARLDQPATLAYATEMSAGNLLASTNAERTSRGLAPLTLNQQLNNSATSKARDMVARNYWAHNTPDGQEPWIFFEAAGYNYQKAGENLAYGFSTSGETITGWMNSPSHRDNMLDGQYNEVGFGFHNGPNFNGSGEETVVVAHYGRTAGVQSTPAPPSPQSTVQPVAEQPAPEPEPEPEPQPFSDDRINQPTTSDSPVVDDAASTNITRLQQLTNGDAPWSALLLAAGASSIVLIWLIKHAVLVKRYVTAGEHFVAHHPILDIAVVAIAAIAVYLSQSSGVVL